MIPAPLARWFGSLPVRGKLTVALTVQLVVLTLGCLSFLLAMREQAAARSWVAHTHEVIGELENLRAEVLEQQTALRGYLITTRQEFLEPYASGVAGFDTAAQRLRVLVADDPAQSERLTRVEQLMDDWRHEVAEPDIAWMKDPATRALAFEQTASGRGKRRIDAIKRLCAEMGKEEQRLLSERVEWATRVQWVEVGLIGFLLLLGWITGTRAVATLDRLLGRPLSRLAELVPELGRDPNHQIPYRERSDEVGALAGAFETLRDTQVAQREREWIGEQAALLIGALQDARAEDDFGEVLLRRLCGALDAGYGLAYRWNADLALLEWCAAYGLPDEAATRRRFRLGEGLVGQCMVERRVMELSPVPEGYLSVVSGLGAARPRALMFVPMTARGETIAVLELGMLQPVEPRHRRLLEQAMVTSALAWDALARSIHTRKLLEQSQAQAEELHAQQEAMQVQQQQLRMANESLRARGELLEEQGRRLKASDEELRAQTEELKVTNSMLEEKTEALRLRQAELEASRVDIERKAADVERASRYKSEFLANMSHELRTPLNSMLILSKLLADNADGNLDAEQVESARIMHDSGQSLLNLINDILDLSKVEAGKMNLVFEDVNLVECLDALVERFRPMAAERGLSFERQLGPGLPDTLHTDGARLTQILSNLLSNAFKFTHQGGVELSAEADPRGVMFRVRDTGIGIPEDRLARVFQAFEQAESGTSRRYGGTGLGLSIVSGMTALLGGEVQAQSQEGKGSVFSILLPERRAAIAVGAPAVTVAVASDQAGEGASITLRANHEAAPAGPPALMVVEDDARFARVLADVAARRGLEVLIAGNGQQAMELARARQLSGVLLDIGLPDISGWKVLEALKANPHTAQVPVHVISGDEQAERSLALGAVGFLRKPVTRDSVLQALRGLGEPGAATPRRLLVVDDDPVSRLSVRRLLTQEGAEIVEVGDGASALHALETQHFDGLILDLSLPDISGFDLLDRAAQVTRIPPVVIYSARELKPEEHLRLRAHTESIVIKGARAPERLLDEVALFLHAIEKPPPEPARAAAPAPGGELAGKVVLVVDDDMRNVFALSKALRARGLGVVMAQDGHKALAQLEARQDIDLVLMDIMMPGMDGYETIRRIRTQAQWAELPIIAVTAKAMKGDREKCIEAGANDYCAKPIDMEKLMSLLHVWI